VNQSTPSIDEIFSAAMEQQSPEARAVYLDEVCGSDLDLRRRVERLLDAQPNVGSFLDSPAAGPTMNLPPHQVMEGPGTVIGPYKLLEQIGEGGMGIVYMAEQTRPVRRKVALKIIKPGMDTKQVIARFEAERQALAMMDHPNIAKVLDAGATESGRPYFVMELVRGIPITEYCDRHRLPIPDRLDLFMQVCQAVQHAHQKGIIHRDIKPTNVLVTSLDGVPLPRIIDFGIAKATGQSLTDKTLFTGFAQLIGTPLYMSPEQAELSAVDIDTRSDIYSLGVLLYELLTGTTPFDQDTFRTAALDEVRRMIREDEPPKPSTRLSALGATLTTVSENRQTDARKLDRSLRGELDWIVMKALEKDRRRRYETPSGLVRDVERYLAGDPVEAGPPSAWYRFRKFGRRNRIALSAGVLGSAAVVLFLVLNNIMVGREKLRTAQQRDVALQQRDIADKRTREAVEEAEALERHLTINRVNRAHGEWESNNVAEAERLLDECPTALRSWEWHYVKRLCHVGLLTYSRHAGLGVWGVAFSPDGKLVASGVGGGWYTKPGRGELAVWEAATGREVFVQRGLTGGVQCVAFSPDGKLVAAGCSLRGTSLEVELGVWSAATGRVIFTRRGPDVLSVKFSPDGKQIAAGYGKIDDDRATGLCRLWDAATGEEVASFPGQPGGVACVSFSPDGKQLALASDVVEVWDIKARKRVRALRARIKDRQIHAVAFSPDGHRIAAECADKVVRLWGPDTDEPVLHIPGKSRHYGLAFSPDGRQIATANNDRGVTLWDAATGAEVVTFRGHTVFATAVAFSPDGGRLASASDDDTVKIWDVRARNPLECRDEMGRAGTGGFTGSIYVKAFSPDGQFLATASNDGLRLWKAMSGELVPLPPIPAPFGVFGPGLAFSPDGQRIALGYGDGIVKVLETRTGQEAFTLRGHIGPVNAVTYSPDGRWILSGGADGTIRLWDAAIGRPGLIFQSEPDALPVAQAIFSPDGIRVFSVRVEGTWTEYDAKTGREIRTHRWDEGARGDLVLSPDGRSIVRYTGYTGSDWAAKSNAAGVWMMPNGLTIWDVETGREVRTRRGHIGPVETVVYSPDGRRIASGGRDYAIKLWDPATGEEVFSLRGHNAPVCSLAFSPDGQRLAAGCYENLARLYDAAPIPPEQSSPAAEADRPRDRPVGPAAVPERRRALADHYARQASSLMRSMDPRARDTGHAVAMAKRAIEQAIELDPADGNACNNLAWTLATCPIPQLRDPARAVELARKAVEGGNSFAWFFLAMAHWQLGVEDQACKWYGRAVRWMETNKPQDEDLLRLRDEAAALLGLANLPADVFARP